MLLEAEIQFLHYKLSVWDFPKRANEKIINVKYIFFGPVNPTTTTRKGYTLDEDSQVLSIYKQIKLMQN